MTRSSFALNSSGGKAERKGGETVTREIWVEDTIAAIATPLGEGGHLFII
jgi:hypothetical protein